MSDKKKTAIQLNIERIESRIQFLNVLLRQYDPNNSTIEQERGVAERSFLWQEHECNKKLIATEREQIEEAFISGMNNIIPHSHEWTEYTCEYEYFTAETIEISEYYTNTYGNQ